MHTPQASRRFSAASVLGVVLIGVSIIVTAGWLLQKPQWVRFDDGAVMVLNSALCFGLMALALMSELLTPARQRVVQSVLGILVAFFAGLVLSEYVLGGYPGIDWDALHRWYQVDNAHPGRMPLPTVIAFVLCGAVLVLMHRVRGLWSGLLVQAFTIVIIAIGSIGIAGCALKLALVYDNYPFGLMALTTAIGLVLTGIALWLQWARADWYRFRVLIAQEAWQISLHSAVVLAGIVCVSMLTGLVLTQHQIESLAGSSLSWPLKSRIDLFKTNIDLRLNTASAIATRPDVVQLLVAINERPDDAEALARLSEMSESYLPLGFSGISFQSLDGKDRVTVGRFFERPALKVELRTPSQPSMLMWGGEHFVLLTRMPALRDGAPVGVMVAEQRMTALTAALEYAHDFAATGEISVCARQSENLSCFPQRHVPKIYTVPYSAALPMARALANETGVSAMKDSRDRNVMAAYGPVGTLGLGMVVQVDATEIYAPLREQLYLVLALALMIVAGGAVLLHWRVSPLARNLYLGEQRLKLALESSRTAWWDWDIQTGALQLSEHWQSMLGTPAQKTSTTLDELEKLVHPGDLSLLRSKLRASLASGAVQYDVEHRVQKPDGSWLWVHSIGRVAERDRMDKALRMIGINSDITQRKEAALRLGYQAQHDAVTGLPNGLMFDDRLQQAIARARYRNAPIAVIYLDIGDLDRINDNFGQPVCNDLLKSFAQRVGTCVRAVDTVARLSSDTFAIVLEELASPDDGRRISQRIVDAAGQDFIIVHRSIKITINLGIAFYFGEADAPAPEALLQAAEKAHYEAKNAKRQTTKSAN